MKASEAEETTSKLVAFLHEQGLRQDSHPETKTNEGSLSILLPEIELLD